MIVRAGLIGLAGLIAFGTAACDGGGSDEPTTILLVGDSILAQSTDETMLALVKEGWVPVIDARPGTRLEPKAKRFDWPPRVEELADAVSPDVAVVELGTNDCADSARLADEIDAVMEPLADVDVVRWLNLPTVECQPAFDEQLRTATDRWSNLEIVDAASHFDGHPEWIIGIHLTRDGQDELARLIRTEVRMALEDA